MRRLHVLLEILPGDRELPPSPVSIARFEPCGLAATQRCRECNILCGGVAVGELV